jgi:predicted GIY-YIG superfamily endonuclease
VFTYVYILESQANPAHSYVGTTLDLHERLTRHNRGAVSHTSRYHPWTIKTAIAFRDASRAAAFERYLKSPSGRAFARKRL